MHIYCNAESCSRHYSIVEWCLTDIQSGGRPRGVALQTTATKHDAVHASVIGRCVHAIQNAYDEALYRRCQTFGWSRFESRLWQRNYYEHVIRNEESLHRIREYILDNPTRWEFDRENPLAMQPESADAWR